ncbi:MAG: substrate-binding domain-containing protein [Candidatus Gallimonas sp.]
MRHTTRTPLYNQIMEYLLRLIAINLKEDDYGFPSEIAIALQFNVSRTTSRRAVLELTERGFLIRRQGSGTKINTDMTPEMLEELNSYLNENVSSQPERSRKTVAVILPDLKSRYMSDILDGIQNLATQNGWDILVAISNYDQDLEEGLVRRLLSHCNGLIIFPVNKTTYNREIVKLSLKNYPLVVIDNLLRGVEMSSITSDNRQTAYKAVKHLISRGKKNIGIISHPFESAFSLQERYRGYQDALIENNLPINPNLMLNTLNHYDEHAVRYIREFLEKHPQLDALISFNYELGLKTVKIIKNSFNSLTTDDLIIFDEEFEELYDLMAYKLNYIKQNAFRIGQTAFSVILDKTTNPNSLNRHIVIPEEMCFHA